MKALWGKSFERRQCHEDVCCGDHSSIMAIDPIDSFIWIKAADGATSTLTHSSLCTSPKCWSGSDCWVWSLDLKKKKKNKLQTSLDHWANSTRSGQRVWWTKPQSELRCPLQSQTATRPLENSWQESKKCTVTGSGMNKHLSDGRQIFFCSFRFRRMGLSLLPLYRFTTRTGLQSSVAITAANFCFVTLFGYVETFLEFLLFVWFHWTLIESISPGD